MPLSYSSKVLCSYADYHTNHILLAQWKTPTKYQ